MLKFDEFTELLEKVAPLSLSELSIANGGYDNSGVIVKCGEQVKSILFSLDLSLESVKRAVELGCDTILTHHPAIYYPIKNLSIDDVNTAPLVIAMQNSISIISMHLNLDVAEMGIDSQLALGLGANNVRILDELEKGLGYGREFNVNMSLEQFVKQIKEVFNTQKIIAYGAGEVEIVASFCGAGCSHALDAFRMGKSNADTIVTSDLAHHEIKEIIENGKKLVILPHYVSEDYGFNNFYQCVTEMLNGKADTHYFKDKRFS